MKHPPFLLFASLLSLTCLPSPVSASPLVGNVGSQMSVNSKGSANYQLPIYSSRGAVFGPSVALSYDSSSGNGVVGTGWNLSAGVSSIQRGRSIYARDGFVDGVDFQADDRLYLDGKVLVQINSGSVGYLESGAIYRTEVESFQTIYAKSTGALPGQPIDSFEIEAKDGTRSYYGKYAGTTDGYHQFAGETEDKAYAYFLKRVQNPVGEAITYNYEQFSSGEHRLHTITFGKDSDQTTITCEYNLALVGSGVAAARLDYSEHYLAGRSEAMRSRLDRVLVSNGAGTLSQYSFFYEYSPSTRLTRLTSLQVELASAPGGTLESVPPIILGYSDYASAAGGARLHNATQSVPGFTAGTRCDIDGDGVSEMIIPSETQLTLRRFIVSGEGPSRTALTVDSVVLDRNWPTYSALSSTILAANPVFYAAPEIQEEYPMGYSVADFNHDGRSDVIIPMPALDGIYVCLSDGSKFLPPTLVQSITMPDGRRIVNSDNYLTWSLSGTVVSTYEGTLMHEDINGDGILDLVCVAGTKYHKRSSETCTMGLYVSLGKTNLEFAPWTLAYQFAGVDVPANWTFNQGLYYRFSLTDIDGNGLPDVLFTATASLILSGGGGVGYEQKSFVGLLNHGGVFSSNQSLETTTLLLNLLQSGRLCDMNGDGVKDILYLQLAIPTTSALGMGVRSFNYYYPSVYLGDGTGAVRPAESLVGCSVKIAGTEVASAVVNIDIQEGPPNEAGCSEPNMSDYEEEVCGWLYFDASGYLSACMDYEMCVAASLLPTENIVTKTFGEMSMLDVNGDGCDDYVWSFYDRSNASYSINGTANSADGVAHTAVIYGGPGGFRDFQNGSPDLTADRLADTSGVQNWKLNSGDFDGDGNIDLFLEGNLYLGGQRKADLLVSATNSLGSADLVQYQPLTDPTIYTPGAPVSYPIIEDRSARTVVSQITKDSGGSTPQTFSYQYSGSRIDLSGRGPLGFQAFVTLDHQTNLFKYQFLTQSFPMTGLAVREQTYRFWQNGSYNFRLLTSHDNTVVFDEVTDPANSNTPTGTVYPFISQAIESRWEDAATAHYTLAASGATSSPDRLFINYSTAPPANAHITITAASLFDNQATPQTTLPGAYRPGDISAAGTQVPTGYAEWSDFSALNFPQAITHGNLKNLSTDFGDGFTETVATTYKAAPTAAPQLTGLVDTVTTTVSSTGYGTETAPTKSYTYWGNTPLVATETLDATGTLLDTKTTTTRDAQGRVLTTTLEAPGDTAIGTYVVSTNSDYDDRFDLPKTTKNAAGYEHTTTAVYHPLFGTPTKVTDPNGLETTTTYDALGRALTVTDPFGLVSTNTYSWDATVTVTPPSGSTALTLTSAYKMVTTSTAKPTVTTYYDRLGRAIRTTKTGFTGTLVSTDTLYNTLGQTVATSLPYPAGGTRYWTLTEYDPLGRVMTVTAPNGTVTTNTYSGRTTQVTIDAPDRAPQTNTTYVDAKGRTIKVWNADNVPTLPTTLSAAPSATASIEYVLDGFGRMRTTRLKDQTQLITATYDALGRQTQLADPDKGTWNYVNNALGQVTSQTDAKGNATTTTYDRLGRTLTRVTTEPNNGPVETANWYYYDLTADAAKHTVAKGTRGWIGALHRDEAQTTGLPAYIAPLNQTTYYYDHKGRPAITLTTTDGKWFYTYQEYDSNNRPSATRHYWRPPGYEAPTSYPYDWQTFGYTYTYSSQSYLLTMGETGPGSNRTWWEIDPTTGYDYMDRPVKVRKGSGHWTTRTYRPEDGTLSTLQTGANNALQNHSYTYDGLGNLKTRSDTLRNLGETFTYDTLNRLTNSSITGAISYADNGNITGKTSIEGTPSGTYAYSASKPHAVTSAFGYTMSYDANGNMVTRTNANGTQTWATRWAGFDKPRWLAKSTTNGPTNGSEFHYNANRSRTTHLEFDQLSSGVPHHYTRKKIYGLGATLEADYKNNNANPGTPDWALDKIRIYIPGPEGTAGTIEYAPSDATGKPLVYHYDHLGSIETITPYADTSATAALDPTGKPSRYAYDAWGERRNPTTWTGKPTDTADGGSNDLSPRGYTGHEMLDDLGLVHMNGRIYDGMLGRFLSADIVVQAPGSLQSYNRYSYVMNNPLTMTDPTGYFWDPDSGFWGASEWGTFGKAMLVDPAVDTFNEGSNHMANGFQQISDGNYVEGGLNVVAAIGKTAEIALDLVPGGKQGKAGVKLGMEGLEKGAEAASKLTKTMAKHTDDAAGGAAKLEKKLDNAANKVDEGTKAGKTEPNRVYRETKPGEQTKHGTQAKSGSKGDNSAAPKDGQAALDNSVQSTDKKRVGVDTENKEVVVLSRDQTLPNGTETYHGHVPEKLSQAEANALRESEELSKKVKLKNDGTTKVK